MKRWQLAGFISTIIILLSVPLYMLRVSLMGETDGMVEKGRTAAFVGRETCKSCHSLETEKWQGSDHDKAMDIASPDTVLGNFNGVFFEHNGIRSRFFRQGEQFYVNTQGPDGKMADFRISHTFGHYPLQQYLIPFDNGRLQSLSIAWDVDQKRWFHLNPGEKIAPGDWMHWTRQSHNWNGMCSECHSTNLKKGYDPKTKRYQTTWSEIDVSCEACHGPGSLHVEWANLPELARPVLPNADLVVKTRDLNSEQLISICARCHSRRVQLDDYEHSRKEILDGIIPELLTDSLYHADGQILDEVYVYGSFIQSKMFGKDVKCSDCHDVHSGQVHFQGNDLCFQCHRAEAYDTKRHHFHLKKGEKGEALKNKSGQVISEVGQGAECIKCHMPGQFYMGIDYRLDHSFRIPRPDLSKTLGTPNACNNCHSDKSKQWADDYFTQWHGLSRKPHYGEVLDAGRKELPNNRKELMRLADDSLLPVIVRATALQLLGSDTDEKSQEAFHRALNNGQPLIRYAAVRYFNDPDIRHRLELLSPLLVDPVMAVRMETVISMAMIPEGNFNAHQKKAFKNALAEYEAAMEYSADFTFSGLNLGNLYYLLGQPEKAVGQYRLAIEIATEFNPAKMNLAILLSGQGSNQEAEKLLREIIEIEPNAFEAHYKLGLLLAGANDLLQAVKHLKKAADGLGNRARVYFNLGLSLQRLNRFPQAESALLKAIELDSYNADFLYGAAYFYYQSGQLERAKQMARRILDHHPTHAAATNILKIIDKKRRGQ